jgi:hypothetical protein
MHPFDVASFLLVTVGGAVAAAATIFGNRAADGLAALGVDEGGTEDERTTRALAKEALAQSQRRNEVRRRSVIAAGLVLVALGVIAFVAARLHEAPAAA